MAQNPVRKGRPCSGRAQQGNAACDEYRHVTHQSTCTIFPRRTAADALEDDPSSAGPLPAAYSLRPPVKVSSADACGYPGRSIRFKGVFRCTEPHPSPPQERPGQLSSCLGWRNGRLFPAPCCLSPPLPARSRLAGHAPTSNAHGLSGFWVRQVVLHFAHNFGASPNIARLEKHRQSSHYGPGLPVACTLVCFLLFKFLVSYWVLT